MVIKVGINGFGRIGRVIFRSCHLNPDLEVAAINDPAIDIEYICYLIKFDSTHGKFRGSVTRTQNEIIIDDVKIKIFHDKLPSIVPWHTAEVEYVVESSGIFTSLQKASGHLAGEGVKRVIVTAPSSDVPMVILGVNDAHLDIGTKVISSASSTLYCLAPMVKILNDHYGVSEGFLTSIHAMTPSLKPLDGLCLRGKHWRDHRSILQNIIPATTGACKALGKIIPEVKDKLAGVAFRVPIVNVSVLDLTLRLNKETSIEEITKAVDAYSKSTMTNIVKISKEEAVSSDFVGDQHSCILDVDSSLQLKKDFFKLVCWYENEYSYACRVIDLILFSEKQYRLNDPRNKNTFVRSRKSLIAKKLLLNQSDEIQKLIQPMVKSSQMSHSSSQISVPIQITLPLRPGDRARPLIMRKPLSANNSANSQDICKSDAVFRIWNDDETKKRVQSKSDNHRNSDEIHPQKQIPDNTRAKQRLENVKKEFSKMVSITERLLNKCSKTREEDKTKANNGADNKKMLEDNDESLYTFNISGDVSNIEDRSSKNYCSTDNFSDLNIYSSAYNISSSKQGSNDTLNAVANCNSSKVVQTSEDAIQAKTTRNRMVDDIFQNQVVRTITNLIDGLSQSMDVKVEAEHNKDTEHVTNLNETLENKSDSGFVSPIKNKIGLATGIYDEITSTTLPMEGITQIEVNRVEIKGNSAFNSGRTKIISHVAATDQMEILPAEFNTPNTDCCSAISIRNPAQIPAQILNSLNRYFDPLVIKADNSKCENSTLTASIYSDASRKMDLYDKLDSVSGSDSENSFQINERKSQVIDISDLTNSLDDLVRLDKICRIIEISDELSDKLFSALGSTDNAAVQKTKWSFKDLCKRIKLDEFCNSLFAQSCHYEQKK